MDDVGNPIRWERAIAQATVALRTYRGLAETLKVDVRGHIALCEDLLVKLLAHAPQSVYDDYMRRREEEVKLTRVRSRRRGSEQSEHPT